MSKQKLRVNDAIRTSQVRLIDQSNNQLGIVTAKDAVIQAREAGLDLVEVSPNAEPPVCRIMDFGKYLYEQKRKNKQSHKKQHNVTLKEIRLRPKIDSHDLDIKVNRAIKFVEKGHKVQFTMLFRGREMMHIENGNTLMQAVVDRLGDTVKIERPSKMLGRRMTLVVVPAKS